MSRGNKTAIKTYGLDPQYEEACLPQVFIEVESQTLIQNWLNEGRHFFYYHGAVGQGKTYLCMAILNYLWEKGEEVYFIRATTYLEKVQEDIGQGRNQYSMNDKLSDQEYLIIDDLGTSKNNEWQQGMWFDLIDRRYGNQLPTLITSNFDLKELEKELGPRIASRLGAKENLVLRGSGKDRRK